LPSFASVARSKLFARIDGLWVSLLTVSLIVGILWAAKAILLPLALGIILAFILTPLVRWFDRLRFPRPLGVALTMLLTLSAVGGVGYVVFDQFSDLSAEITKYTSSMRKKVADLRLGDDAALSRLTRTVDRVTEQLDENVDDLRRAAPVRVVPPRVSPGERLQETVHSVFEPLTSAVIVLVLVAFMLGQREDLRDRLIRLIGPESVTLTTRLLDEAAQRVSRFLVAQTLINVGFGVVVTIGLYWIGVPYAALWGGLAAVLKFVPYVGSILSAFIPATLAFATFPGWAQVLETLALFAVLDLICAYFVEPVVLGQRTGVSSFALLVSALFWIWVRGPVGLVLATPLTVCIAVLGRHVRSLRFLSIMFADEPALMPHVRFYQRLLARDEDEASVLVERKLAEVGLVGVIDQVLMPALLLLIQHRAQEEVTAEDATFVLDNMSETIGIITPPAEATAEPRIVGLAARTPADQLAVEMCAAALRPECMEIVPEQLSPERALRAVLEKPPAVVCLTLLTATRGAEVRNYCRKLRAQAPQTKIVVVKPTLVEADSSRAIERLKEAGAHCVVTTTQAAIEVMREWTGTAVTEPAQLQEAAVG
jgi:predicted PurR-regulated permease PerM